MFSTCVNHAWKAIARTSTVAAMIDGRRKVCVQQAKKPGFLSGIRRQDHAHSAITARRPADDYCGLVGALIASPRRRRKKLFFCVGEYAIYGFDQQG